MRVPPGGPRSTIEAVPNSDRAAELKEKQEILESVDLVARMDKVARLLAVRIEVLRLSNEIGRQNQGDARRAAAQGSFPSRWRRSSASWARGDGKTQEVAELAAAIAKANMRRGNATR
ncbi:hypothetical protein AC630_24245 [Bradyrhizobium sp. AS23.2]|nr:hypothetical protein AC630_24245 [Bradyrhizobium sp. AS23.2]